MKIKEGQQKGLVKTVGLSGNTLRERSVALWIFIMVFALLLAPSRTFAESDPECTYSESVSCSGGNVIFTNITVNPTNACLGTAFTASVTKVEKSGSEVTHYVYEDCSQRDVTNGIAVNVLSNMWTATVGAWSASGTELSATFTPTNSGTGNIEFKTYWTDGCSTNIQTASAAKGFTVKNTISASGSVQFMDPEVDPDAGETTNVTTVVSATVKTCCRDGEPITLQLDITGSCIAGFSPTMLGSTGYHITATVGSYSSTSNQEGYVPVTEPTHPETYNAYATGYSRYACIHWTVNSDCTVSVTVAQPPRPAQGQSRNCP